VETLSAKEAGAPESLFPDQGVEDGPTVMRRREREEAEKSERERHSQPWHR
jgi:hypothetical protein